ncbi:MAG: cation:proton antiporter [Rikenellaceae bacterium]|nr:cation:proton antiporter [Rikenellaceae bacterium]
MLEQLSQPLPLENPILIFSLILFIILLAPIIFHMFKIPDLVGLIIAGAIIGPNGLDILERDSSIVLFGTVGLLYLMFVAGLEINMSDFKKNGKKGLLFGFFTFSIPMTLGGLSGYYILGFSIPTSILLASMYASHTLITYPIISKYGITKNRAVTVTISGTVITDILALLVLAVIVGMETGELSNFFWIKLTISTIVFGTIVIYGFPYLVRWFFKKIDDSVSKYIFVVALVFLAAFLSELAGLEGIVGAFLAGLSLNRLIPNTSALLNRIEFVGNTLFIPFFLIGVGMLIDYRVFISDWTTIYVAVTMTIIATVSKYSAAWLAQQSFRFSKDERLLIFGLSNSQAAATLAAVLVGYQVIIGITPEGEPVRLLSDSILNGTIIMILFTCIIAPFATQKASQNIAVSEITEEELVNNEDIRDRVLVAIHNPENIEEMINLAVTVKSKKANASITALNVIPSENHDAGTEKKSKTLLEKAAKVASGSDNRLDTIMRYDEDPANGIKNAVKEHKITNVILGIRKHSDIIPSFLGTLTDKVLSKCATTTMIYRPYQPLSTVKRYMVVIPPDAEKEIGFPYWLIRLWNIGKNTGSKILFYANSTMISILKEVQNKQYIDADYIEFGEWEDFLIISRDIKDNDALIIIMSRRTYPSYTRNMNQVPSYLSKYFNKNNYILIFPVQLGIGEQDSDVLKSIPHTDANDGFEELANVMAGLFRRLK